MPRIAKVWFFASRLSNFHALPDNLVTRFNDFHTLIQISRGFGIGSGEAEHCARWRGEYSIDILGRSIRPHVSVW